MKTFLKTLSLLLICFVFSSCNFIEKKTSSLTVSSDDIKQKIESEIKDSLSAKSIKYKTLNINVKKVETGKYMCSLKMDVNGETVWVPFVAKYDGSEISYNKDIMNSITQQVKSNNRVNENKRKINDAVNEMRRIANDL